MWRRCVPHRDNQGIVIIIFGEPFSKVKCSAIPRDMLDITESPKKCFSNKPAPVLYENA